MQESKSETMTEQSSGLPSYRPRTFSNGYVHRGREHDYPSNDHRRLSRSQSREEMGKSVIIINRRIFVFLLN